MAGCGLRHGQSPSWGDAVGPNPTDRAEAGSKPSVLVDGSAGPLNVVVAGANVHDTKLLRQALQNIVVERRNMADETPVNQCLDKGMTIPPVGERWPSMAWARPAHRGGETGHPGDEAPSGAPVGS